MRSPRIAQVDLRERNSRLTRIQTRAIGRSNEFYPFFPFVDINEENQALYLQFDKPLPPGTRHSIHFRCRGESWLPQSIGVDWEILEDQGYGRYGWRSLHENGTEDSYAMNRTGVLDFPLQTLPDIPQDGFWIRVGWIVGSVPVTTP